MAWKDKITKSFFGRQFGLQQLSTTVSGGSRGELDYLVGPEAIRGGVTTADTTAINLHPFGVAYLQSTSAGSSAVFTIDPPVPGVGVTVLATTDGPVYVKTANDEAIVTSAGSSFTTVKVTSLGGSFQLMGVTTGLWAGVGLTTGTSSQGSGFGLTTST